MDGVEPVPTIDIALSSQPASPVEHRSFGFPNGDRAVAIWLAIEGRDDSPGITTDLHIPVLNAVKVTAVDTLNGTELELKFTPQSYSLTIPDLRIRDYPILLRINPGPQESK